MSSNGRSAVERPSNRSRIVVVRNHCIRHVPPCTACDAAGEQLDRGCYVVALYGFSVVLPAVLSSEYVDMKAQIIVVSWCVSMFLLLVRTPVCRAVKSNSIATYQLPQRASSAHLLQGSRSGSQTAEDCPVLPPCRCVQLPQTTRRGPPSQVRVMCDTVQTSGRRVLRFSKTSAANRSFERLSLAYAGLSALPADAFRHVQVTLCHTSSSSSSVLALNRICTLLNHRI